MDKRRENKTNKEKYDTIKILIRKKIRQAKEIWYGDLCSEIEKLDKKFDCFNMHKKIKELISPKHQGRRQVTLLNKYGNYASSTDNMLVTWEQYVTELFHDTRSDPVDFVCARDQPLRKVKSIMP
ncbi:unnamed protein product [Leptidea sinapis]|uniref:Uncharacterized protein n=1 Tax=Leptidea sinapis TaxID=189913 RepID=A0A5E4Q3Q0_9NEOP|nr:unnamed protein product [Leptidea sinapis]